MSDPITVNATAVPDQLGAALRQFLVGLGAYMAGKGWIDEGLAAATIPMLLIVGPMLWSQLIVRQQHQDAKTLAAAVDDSVGRVK